MAMDYRAMEKKWEKKWEETKLYSFDPNQPGEKKYVLEMFSYPSAAKLHIGHWYNYGPADSFARFKRMQGYNVFHPMGFDAFGLPAENYAIKTGIHPKDSTYANMEIMEEQLRNIGGSFDWNHTVKTCDPGYYKWTQWLFLQLYKNGLAYRKEAPVNWCPSCNTVLANEQVVDGCCERCHTAVTRRNLTQWFFRITQYADELLADLPKLDWPERIKAMQVNWIGRSEGAEITFSLENGGSFPVFTTRADTLFGNTYCVLAPEHPLVDSITTPEQKEAVDQYREYAAGASDIDRLSTAREKTGVFTGGYAINPINGRKVPIWIADYVLFSYGTGAVMAVPAHDERDYEFALKYDLPIERVVEGGEGLPYIGSGKLINSPGFDGMENTKGIGAIVAALEEKGMGKLKVNYRMRDWLISRQRYWGAPIPMIHCEHCGVVPVPEDQLPVELPYDVDFTPDGTSPLLKNEAFMNVTCPVCGQPARRDADTMDTFVCSSWYYLRYPDCENTEEAFNIDIMDKMLPVDMYIGGAEHACMHLLYARFFTKALRDMGLLHFDEPFLRLVNQGLILGPDGEKMSKSRGNVVSPDDYIDQYGSDVFRMYLMFGFSYIEGGAWNDDGIKAISRFLDRVERLVGQVCENGKPQGGEKVASAAEKELLYVLANTVSRVTDDLERLSFNTAIARIMELVNALYRYREAGANNAAILWKAMGDLVLMLAPFAPHFAEEMFNRMGGEYSVFQQKWPECNEADMVRDIVNIAVQVNGRVRARLDVEAQADNKAIEAAALADEKVQAALEGLTVQKVIVIPKRLVSIVAK
ncbi:MAG: leucine--tRNA ligase [Clostridia bacterium]|nr:leucine--tRNA ligase [Clostridia bacterium]